VALPEGSQRDHGLSQILDFSFRNFWFVMVLLLQSKLKSFPPNILYPSFSWIFDVSPKLHGVYSLINWTCRIVNFYLFMLFFLSYSHFSERSKWNTHTHTHTQLKAAVTNTNKIDALWAKQLRLQPNTSPITVIILSWYWGFRYYFKIGS